MKRRNKSVMSDSSKPFLSRLDRAAVRELRERALPAPVDALNLVAFTDKANYFWYGVLIAPRLIFSGARPVWVAAHEQSLHGDRFADEIVIVFYPDHRVLVDAVASRYYGMVNRFRERGVKRFEFSITERLLPGDELKRGKLFLVAHFNPKQGDEETSLQSVREVLETADRRMVYASREVADLAIFKPMLPSDPNPARFKNTAVFSVPDVESVSGINEGQIIDRLGEATAEHSLHLYRRLSFLESLPWPERKTDQPLERRQRQ
jgi:uncharacterized protein (DUF1330 family)